MDTKYQVVLYGQGLFAQDNPSVNQQQLQAIQTSGFNTVILFSLHVNEPGDLYYGDNPIVQGGVFNDRFTYLPALVKGLKAGGGVGTVMFGIGSADAADYAHLKELLGKSSGIRTLQNNFNALTRALQFDGFDFDLEVGSYAEYTGTMVKLTLLLHQNYGSVITYCPYQCEDDWLAFLADVYAKNGNRQIVSRFNLQCYGGGKYTDPADWVAQIENYGSPLGISDARAFVVAGYSADDDGPPAICQTFSGLEVGGGFIWNSGAIFRGSWTPADYAQAIVNGLNRQC